MGANDKLEATFHGVPDIESAGAVIRKQFMREAVIDEVQDELDRQDTKWGEQNHPNGTGPYQRLLGAMNASQYKELRNAAIVHTDRCAHAGNLSYTDIFLEEVFEALAEENPAKLRAELIQCAAVAVAWVEKIDRDTARKEA